MKRLGAIILFIGLLVTLFTGFDLVTTENNGKEVLRINGQQIHSLTWSPVIGSIMMIVGAGCYLIGIVKNQQTSDVQVTDSGDSITYK
jgi:hypothetical protein